MQVRYQKMTHAFIDEYLMLMRNHSCCNTFTDFCLEYIGFLCLLRNNRPHYSAFPARSSIYLLYIITAVFISASATMSCNESTSIDRHNSYVVSRENHALKQLFSWSLFQIS